MKTSVRRNPAKIGLCCMVAILGLLVSSAASAVPFLFGNGDVGSRLGTPPRPGAGGKPGVEAAAVLGACHGLCRSAGTRSASTALPK